jgi:hypothetical protein
LGQLPNPVKKLIAKQSQLRNDGWINGCTPRSVKRNLANRMNIGSWNVLSLLKPGKMQELAEQITRIKLDVVAIQEIRWSGTGLSQKKDFSFYYSGANNDTGQAGIGFLIQKKMQKHII